MVPCAGPSDPAYVPSLNRRVARCVAGTAGDANAMIWAANKKLSAQFPFDTSKSECHHTLVQVIIRKHA
eukprot:8915234-Prorocentrum_lima.AAC.1